MEAEKILEVCGIYRSFFESQEISKKKHSDVHHPSNFTRTLRHCHWMLDEIDKFVSEGRIEKAMKWLGFVQGCLWSTGHYVIDDLQEHNRPS